MNMPDFLQDPQSFLITARTSGLPIGYFPRRNRLERRRWLVFCGLILAVLLTLAADWPK
jgi:hypothetical protein